MYIYRLISPFSPILSRPPCTPLKTTCVYKNANSPKSLNLRQIGIVIAQPSYLMRHSDCKLNSKVNTKVRLSSHVAHPTQIFAA